MSGITMVLVIRDDYKETFECLRKFLFVLFFNSSADESSRLEIVPRKKIWNSFTELRLSCGLIGVRIKSRKKRAILKSRVNLRANFQYTKKTCGKSGKKTNNFQLISLIKLTHSGSRSINQWMLHELLNDLILKFPEFKQKKILTILSKKITFFNQNFLFWHNILPVFPGALQGIALTQFRFTKWVSLTTTNFA